MTPKRFKFKMRTMSWILIGAIAAIFALAEAAFATALTLTGPIQGNQIGPQSTSNPCIIAGTTCQQPAFMGYNNFIGTGSISSYNMYSTTPTATVLDGVQGTPYTVGQLANTGTKEFLVAIDVNTTGAKSETLQLFEVIVNGVVFDNYIGPTLIGDIANNGNGFADWTLGVVDLSSFADTATVLFHAQWDNAVDGNESFFLIPGRAGCTGPNCFPTIPEPSALILFGAGLVFVSVAYRRFALKK